MVCLGVNGAVENIRTALVGLGVVDEKVAVFVGGQLEARTADAMHLD